MICCQAACADGEHGMSLEFTAIVWPLFVGMSLAIGFIHSIIWLKRTRETRFAEELKSANAELHKVHEQMDLISEAAAVGMWEWDSQRDIIWVTEQTRALYGFGAAESIDFDRFLSAVHTDDRAAVREAALQSLRDGNRFQREYRINHADGSISWMLTRGRVEVATADASALLRGISLDISERRRRDELMQQERAFLRQIIDINPNLIFAKDRAGRFTLVNRVVADIYGTTVDNLLGKTDADFNPNAAEVEWFHKQDMEVMDSLREHFIPEEPVTDVAGRVHWLQTVKQPILNSDGSADQLLGTSTDITERKQTELELTQQRNELAHLSRVMMLSELSGSLAHELNQPLAAILSNAQAALRFLARDTPDLDEIREILRDIVADDKRAGEVIQGLRAMLKKGELRREPVKPNALVQDVVRLLRSDMLNAGVIYTMELAPQLPDISGIYVQLQQVLLNLMVNACDAMVDAPAANRRLQVSATHDGTNVVFRVCDRGHGIPVEDVTQVFQPFYTTKMHGLGLGLAVCRRLIEAHRGKIWATNNIGEGASFFFSVPIKSQDER